MKKIFTYALIAVLLFVNKTNAQPAIQWQKCLGGSGNDVANCIIKTQDGGYAVAGYSNSNDGNVVGNHGQWDFWVAKLDMMGNIQWSKSLGGSLDESAGSIIQTADGGYALAGWSRSNNQNVNGNHGGEDCWVVKLDMMGNLQWQKSLGGAGNEKAQCIIATQAGGYAIAGWTNSNDGNVAGFHGGAGNDIWVAVLDNLGALQWQKCLGGTGNDVGYSLIQIAGGSFMVAGGVASNDGDVNGNHGGGDYWMAKLSNAGILQSQKCYGGAGADVARSIIQTNDGGFAMNGSSNSNDGDVNGNHGGNDNWFVKTDNNGNLTMQKSLGGGNEDEGNSIIKTLDGGYLLTGFSNSNNGDVSGNHGIDDFWMAKLTIAGNLEWQKSMGGANSDWAFSAVQTMDGGYALAGFAWSNDGDVFGNHNPGIADFWVVKLFVAVLPIELQEFNGKETAQGNELSWTTASETNNSHFIIERSQNGIDFSGIGTVQGNGTSQLQHKYSFNDNNPFSGNNYYRLKQVNFDGAFTFSKTIRVNNSKANGNPAANYQVVEYSLNAAGAVKITLSNAAGQVFIEKNKNEQVAGNHKETLDMSEIANGEYIVKLQAADQTITMKISKD